MGTSRHLADPADKLRFRILVCIGHHGAMKGQGNAVDGLRLLQACRDEADDVLEGVVRHPAQRIGHGGYGEDEVPAVVPGSVHVARGFGIGAVQAGDDLVRAPGEHHALEGGEVGAKARKRVGLVHELRRHHPERHRRFSWRVPMPDPASGAPGARPAQYWRAKAR